MICVSLGMTRLSDIMYTGRAHAPFVDCLIIHGLYVFYASYTPSPFCEGFANHKGVVVGWRLFSWQKRRKTRRTSFDCISFTTKQ